MSLSIRRLATWQRAVFLVNSRLGRFTAAPAGSPRSGSPAEASLLPKLRDQVAEFLKGGSLARLRILSSPTCVGLRYGHSTRSLRGFSRQPASASYRAKAFAAPSVYAPFSPEHLLGFHGPGERRPRPSWLRPPVGSLSRAGGDGILTVFPSTTPFGLVLGTG